MASEASSDRGLVLGQGTQQRRRRRLGHRRRLDGPLADRPVATGDAVEMGTIDDTLASPLCLPVDGNLARTMPDAHLAARDRHRDALTDQLPRHRVAVRVDLDGTVVSDDTGEFAQSVERRPCPERLQAMRLVALEAGDRRLASRAVDAHVCDLALPLARCASNASQLSKLCPAIAFFFTYPTPLSVLPFVRARYGAQARGEKPQCLANAMSLSLNWTVRVTASWRTTRARGLSISTSADTPPKDVNALSRPVNQLACCSCRNARTCSRRECPSVATNTNTFTLAPPISTNRSPKSICNCRPGGVSNRVVASASAFIACR